MIAPPTALYVDSSPAPVIGKKPTIGNLGQKLGMTGPLGRSSGIGDPTANPAQSVAEKIMGWFK